MINRNMMYAPPPHEAPTILDATSETYKYPKENILSITKPGRPWRTNATDADQLLDVSVTVGINGVLINRTNYELIKVEKGIYATLWENAGPNVVRQSDLIANWTVTYGSVTRTPSYAMGPLSLDRPATRCQFTVADSVLQANGTMLLSAAGRDYVGSIWARTTSKGSSDVVQVGLRFTSLGDTYTNFVVTSEWQRLVVTRNSTGAAGLQAHLIVRGPDGTEDILLMGAQVTPDVTAHVGHDYWTVDVTSSVLGSSQPALKIRTHPRNARRKINLRFGAGLAICDSMRFRIIADQTTDDEENYSTGAIIFTKNLTMMPGNHEFPRPVGIPTATREVVLESGAKELLELGDPKVIVSIPGTYIRKQAETNLLALATAPKQPFLIDENMRAAGGGMDSADETDGMLAWMTGEFSSRYEIPEVMPTEFTFEEII